MFEQRTKCVLISRQQLKQIDWRKKQNHTLNKMNRKRKTEKGLTQQKGSENGVN